jgi:hypothetical protein
MKFDRPENLAHLAQTLRNCRVELARTQQGIEAGAGVGSAELIRGAHEYAGDEAHEQRGVDMLAEAQKLVGALRQSELHLKAMIAIVRRADRAIEEHTAKLAARGSEVDKYRA